MIESSQDTTDLSWKYSAALARSTSSLTLSNEHVYQDRLQFQQAVADIYKVFNGNKFQFQQAVRSSHRFVLFVQNAASSMFQNTSIHRDIGGGLKVSCVEIVYQCEDRRLSQLHPRQSHSTPPLC